MLAPCLWLQPEVDKMQKQPLPNSVWWPKGLTLESHTSIYKLQHMEPEAVTSSFQWYTQELVQHIGCLYSKYSSVVNFPAVSHDIWETQPMIRVISKLEINYSNSSGDCNWLMQGCKKSNSVWCSCQHHGLPAHDHPILRGDEYVNCVLYIWKARMWSDFATKDLAKVDACMKIHMYTYICIYGFEMVRVCIYEYIWMGGKWRMWRLLLPFVTCPNLVQDRARPLKPTHQELCRDTDLAYWFGGCDSTLFLLLDDQRPQLP